METEENNEQKRNEDGRSYERPALKRWGTVTDLTSSGGSEPSGDPLGGSVDCD
jgi:hypothetical protein